MSRPIAISLSPNTEAADIQLAWKVLLHSALWTDEDILFQVEMAIAGIFGPVLDHVSDHESVKRRYVALTSSGRQALHDLFVAAGIGSGDEVIIQAFTCIAVPASIQWAGAKPVYADISENTFNIDPNDLRKKITPRTRAIIIQHTFGMPAPIDQIKVIAADYNLLLIEDCAHALGGSYKDQPLGSFGDAAILSFGRDKVISSVFGGAVVSHDGNLIESVRQQQHNRPYPPRRWMVQQLLHPILFHSVILPFYFTSGVGKAILVASQRLGLLSKAVEKKEKMAAKPSHFIYRFSPALAFLVNRQLQKLDEFNERRQEIVDQYVAKLSRNGVKLPTVPEHSIPVWLRFPIRVDEPKKLHAAAKEKNILLGDWYDSVLVPKDSNLSSFGYKTGSCPRAEAAARHVVNLPTYPSLTNSQVKEVIDLVRSNEV